MGLDSYLYAEKHLYGSDNRELLDKVVGELGINDIVTRPSASGTVKIEVAYWRKASQIHNFFVNLDGGEDNCQEIDVSLSDLETLLALCNQALENRDVHPENILPTQSGSFFGFTEYDDYYYSCLQYTVVMLNRILSHEDFKDSWTWSFVYRASW